MFFWTACVYVVVQFYPWFKFCSPLYLIMVMKDNEFETKENEICTKDIIEPQHIHPSPPLFRNRTGDQRRQQTLCDKGDNSFVWRKKLPQTEKPKPQTDLFCKRPENINVKWRSRRNTQTITLSRLSRTSVLPSSSSYLLSMERRRLYPLWLII